MVTSYGTGSEFRQNAVNRHDSLPLERISAATPAEIHSHSQAHSLPCGWMGHAQDHALQELHSDTPILPESQWGVVDDFGWPSTLPVGGYMPTSGMSKEYVDPLYHRPPPACHNSFAHAHPLSERSTSNPEGSDHFQPKLISGRGQHSLLQHYRYTYAGHDQRTEPNTSPLPGAHSAHESPSQKPPVHWDVAPSPHISSISETSRNGVPPLPSQSQSQLHDSLERWPTIDDLRHWPQVFTHEINTQPKKQTLACLFCRERKIGCVRPAEDDPDQTCNQCLRRNKTCEYPTESRRGTHARRRRSAKSNVSTVIPPVLPSTL
ncbi:hypothetical protein B0H13DRAFT_2662140 [Mycena leptocephala]|nr:hypothetical protein B0H13DRAFT_2662140 [Mycena leptocephala]